MEKMRREWKGSLQALERIGDGTASGRWEIVAALGEGGYAEVYKVRDTLTPGAPYYALKIDTQQVKKDPRLATVRNEAEKLKRLQSCEGVPQLVDGGLGKHQGRSYVVMELFADENLAVFQQKAALDVAAIKSIGHQTLKLLQNIHASGWLHRDVKPANFVRTLDSDPASGGQWRIVDFGLAKPYISKDGDIIDPRHGYNEFRGSTNYASVKAHEKEELGRRDDLWSWFYMLVELLQGRLLWRENRAPGKRASGSDDEAKKTAHRMKLRALSDPNTLFSSGRCPEALVRMSRHLAALQFKESPSYTKLQAWLSELTPADVTRPMRPPAGKRRLSTALPGAAEAAHAMHLQHAAAQHWRPPNGVHQHGNTGYTNGHSGWPAHQNGGMNGVNGGVFWHEGQALQMVAPGGWDPPNHPLSQQELLDEAWDTSPASYQQQPFAASSNGGVASHDSQMSIQAEQAALPAHLSVPENWDQQLGQLGSEFGDEPDQAQPKLHQRKRSADRALYADSAAELDVPAPKRARQSPAQLAAPPHLLEDEHGLLLQPPLPDSSASMPAAAWPLWRSSSAAGRPAPGASPGEPDDARKRSLSSALAASATAAGNAARAAAAQSRAALSAAPHARVAHEALPGSQLGSGHRAPPKSAHVSHSQQGRPSDAAASQASSAGMGAYGPAFLQKAISVFDEGRVSVNAKILKKIIPSMDPAEAYTGLAWAGWCIAQNTLPENQTQASQMLDNLGDLFKSLARRGS